MNLEIRFLCSEKNSDFILLRMATLVETSLRGAMEEFMNAFEDFLIIILNFLLYHLWFLRFCQETRVWARFLTRELDYQQIFLLQQKCLAWRSCLKWLTMEVAKTHLSSRKAALLRPFMKNTLLIRGPGSVALIT